MAPAITHLKRRITVEKEKGLVIRAIDFSVMTDYNVPVTASRTTNNHQITALESSFECKTFYQELQSNQC